MKTSLSSLPNVFLKIPNIRISYFKYSQVTKYLLNMATGYNECLYVFEKELVSVWSDMRNKVANMSAAVHFALSVFKDSFVTWLYRTFYLTV